MPSRSFCMVSAGLCLSLTGCFAAREVKTSSGGSDEVGKASEMDSSGLDSGGQVKSEDRKVGSFHRIRVSSAIQATVTIGSPQKVTIEASESFVPKLATTVDGDTLVIEVAGFANSARPMRATVTVPSLDGIEASGASSVEANAIKSGSLEVSVNGASHALIGCSVGSLKVVAGGGSTATFSGDVKEGDYEAGGASTIDLKSVRSQGAKANSSAASTIRFGPLAKGDFEASGASTITYPQSAQVTRSESSGASSINGE